MHILTASAIYATGLAVVWDMLLTTQFLTLVMLTVWKVPTPIAVCFHLFFSAIEATYFSACAEKVPTGKLEPLDPAIASQGSVLCCRLCKLHCQSQCKQGNKSGGVLLVEEQT